MRKQRKPYVFMAWAIDLGRDKHTRDDGRMRLAGRYWNFGQVLERVLPVHLEGCQVALFTTRKIARDMLSLRVIGSLHPHARVVRVEVTLRDMGAY
jgi:hypothetical protein